MAVTLIPIRALYALCNQLGIFPAVLFDRLLNQSSVAVKHLEESRGSENISGLSSVLLHSAQATGKGTGGTHEQTANGSSTEREILTPTDRLLSNAIITRYCFNHRRLSGL